MIDLDHAREFAALHARLLDRTRLACLLDGEPAERVVTALAPYANADGGFGHAIEPDVRTPFSQPLGVLTAFDVLHEIGAPATPLVGAALDWLETVTAGDGGVPFSLPTVAAAPHAPWMAPTEGSSLHMTAALAAAALRVAAGHPWLDRATAFCRERAGAVDGARAYELLYVLDFADATGDEELLDRAARLVPPDGRLPVRGGVEGEALTALDLAPHPGHAARRAVPADAVAADLDAVEAAQLDDGGWDFPWLHWNDAVSWEWRGRRTVDALVLLRANGRL